MKMKFDFQRKRLQRPNTSVSSFLPYGLLLAMMLVIAPSVRAFTHQAVDHGAESAAEANAINSYSLPSMLSSSETPVAMQLQQTGESPAADPPPADPEPTSDWFSAIFVDSWIPGTLMVGGLIVGMLIYRRRKARSQDSGWISMEEEPEPEEAEQAKTRGATRESSAKSTMAQVRSISRLPVATPGSLYGAYRVDQEVGKLVLGQPHRMDVLSSRAPEDRRAIEASLLKVLSAPNSDEHECRRAREALEEYGFVSQQSAALLLATDPYERTSAARLLGEIKSPASLPFLLESLYDAEASVRNQAVLSIGELRLPSAIGALLDIARKHPDVPGALLSRALSACSVEGLDFFDVPSPAGFLSNGDEAQMLEITQLEPAAVVEDLPLTSDDERLASLMAALEHDSPEERADAVKGLGQFHVQTAVNALADLTRHASASSLRALAISSLAAINHESVFPAILIGMADESREVRAAAARAMSRLSFDRADAYVRVTETHDLAALRAVAEACVKSGIAAQAIDRLGSSDRRQAYEAFSVVSLLAKGRVTEPLLDAIAVHASMDVRLSTIHLLATFNDRALLSQLQQLPTEDMPEAVRTALQEAIARMESSSPQAIDDWLVESRPEAEFPSGLTALD